MMDAFYNRFWINNALAIDCQAAYKAAGNALPRPIFWCLAWKCLVICTPKKTGSPIPSVDQNRTGGTGSQKAQYRSVYNLYMKPMGVVPVRLDDEDLKRIDLLVKHQAFRSRNEAIKKMIKTMLSESTADDQDVDKLVESLLKLKKAGKEPLVLRLKQSATEIVASGRDHWPT